MDGGHLPSGQAQSYPGPAMGIGCRDEWVATGAILCGGGRAQGETLVTGAEELRVKESDRLAVMAEGLTRLGIVNELLPDGIRIQGGQRFSAGHIDSHGDHRIAMAFAMASLCSDGEILIDDVENVATSFPDFLQVAAAAGLNVRSA